MKQTIIILALLVGLVGHYCYKIHKQVQILQHNQVIFEQSIDCMKYLQENKNGVCD